MRGNASICRPLPSYPICVMYIHKQTEDCPKGIFIKYTWSVKRANIVDIKASGVGEVKVGQATAWERSGEDTEQSVGKERKQAVRTAGRTSGVSYEEAPSVHGFKAPLQTEEGVQTDTGPSCLAQINPGGSRCVAITLKVVLISQRGK